MKNVIVITLCLLAVTMNAHAALPVANTLTSVLGIQMQDPPEGASGKDGLKVKWVEISYTCLSYPTDTAYVPGTCSVEAGLLKNVQCRPDWTRSPELLQYLDCAARESTGAYKTYYKGIADRIR